MVSSASHRQRPTQFAVTDVQNKGQPGPHEDWEDSKGQRGRHFAEMLFN